MHNDTNAGFRFAALAGAGSITASTLFALALLAEPSLPVAEPPAGHEPVANAVASPVNEEAVERLRITVVGTRDPGVATTPAMVRAKAECPDAAHGRDAGSASRPSEV